METPAPENLSIHLVSLKKGKSMYFQRFDKIVFMVFFFSEIIRLFFPPKSLLHKGDNRLSLTLPSTFSVVHLGPGEERSEDAVMMNTPVIKSALEMGFERSLVKQTVQSKILTSGENYRTVQELVSDLLSAEDQKREEEREMLAEAMASGTFHSRTSDFYICMSGCQGSLDSKPLLL